MRVRTDRSLESLHMAPTRKFYQSGEEIRPGDRILYHGHPGEVQFVVREGTGDPHMDWFAEEFPGGGVMIRADSFGNVFIEDTAGLPE